MGSAIQICAPEIYTAKFAGKEILNIRTTFDCNILNIILWESFISVLKRLRLSVLQPREF